MGEQVGGGEMEIMENFSNQGKAPVSDFVGFLGRQV